MIVPLTLGDFLERAEIVYGDREAVVDEPAPPGGGLGRFTYARFAEMARSLAAALDELGLAEHDRVAIVSPNSARFLVSLFGVSVFGRVLVPVNFRLNADEIGYILEHSGASVLLVDPELDAPLRHLPVKHRLVLDAATDVWGIKVSNVEIKHVDLNESMVRAIARQAEAERERRAKVIHADGEYQAATKLVEAAAQLGREPQSMQLRYLQTLTEVASEGHTTIVFPVPTNVLDILRGLTGTASKPG